VNQVVVKSIPSKLCDKFDRLNMRIVANTKVMVQRKDLCA
jgi:hypothetical protein